MPYVQDGVPNLLDKGVLREGSRRGIQEVVERQWACVNEIPFDFERCLLSVLLRPAQDADAHPTLVCKVWQPPCTSVAACCTSIGQHTAQLL